MNTRHYSFAAGLMISVIVHSGGLWILLNVSSWPNQPETKPDILLVAVQALHSPPIVAQDEQKEIIRPARVMRKPPTLKSQKVVKKNHLREIFDKKTHSLERSMVEPKQTMPQAPTPETTQTRSHEGDGKPIFGVTPQTVTMDAATGMSVPVGNTVMKESETVFTPPEDVLPEAIVPSFELSRLPEYSERIDPIYPKRLAENQVEGQVLLQVTIDSQGHVREVRILKSDHPLFSNAAVEAMKQCVFTPGVRDGSPVAACIEIPVRFELES